MDDRDQILSFQLIFNVVVIHFGTTVPACDS